MVLYVNQGFASIKLLVLAVVGLFAAGARVAGLALATYIGVLIGATVIPAWHFIASSSRFISLHQIWLRR
jgi:uncharacterized membrane protein